MALTLELTLNGTVRPQGRYLTWTPSLASLRIADGDETGPVRITLDNDAASVGQVVFRQERKDAPRDSITLDLPDDGSGVQFLVSGRHGHASVEDRDAVIRASRPDGSRAGTFATMVRIRKDADTLTESERRRFVRALALMNDRETGAYPSFRLSHMSGTLVEAHGRDGFLPWHRAFLLDLERELQLIDRSVALPYWRFDQPAPNLFRPDFMGGPDSPGGFARLDPDNPLLTWNVDGRVGIVRTMLFDPVQTGAHDDNGQFVRPDAGIVDYTGPYSDPSVTPPGGQRLRFEQDPHGSAHTSFTGDIMSPPTAPRDPLFFLLHCNVDRIWAQWQQKQDRFDPVRPAAYTFGGRAGDAFSTRIGHNRLDTMWPWNNEVGGQGPRPPVAPRHPFPSSLLGTPDPAPQVGQMIDYQGRFDETSVLGFDYDDLDFPVAG